MGSSSRSRAHDLVQLTCFCGKKNHPNLRGLAFMNTYIYEDMFYPSYVFIAAERRWVQLPLHHAQVYNI